MDIDRIMGFDKSTLINKASQYHIVVPRGNMRHGQLLQQQA
jgi:hypothetical protein